MKNAIISQSFFNLDDSITILKRGLFSKNIGGGFKRIAERDFLSNNFEIIYFLKYFFEVTKYFF